MKKHFFILFTLFCCCSTFQAQRFYVAPNGSDDNPGTRERPVASLTAVRDLVRAMRTQQTLLDTVFIEVSPGEYFMDKPLLLTPTDAGTRQSPVVFRGQPNASTIFYGGLETGRFEVVNPSLWRVFIPEVARYGLNFEQLYINGKRRFRAQTPNRGEFNYLKRIEETALHSQGDRSISFASQKLSLHQEGLQIINDMEPGELDNALIVLYHDWNNTRKKISHTNSRDTSIFLTGRGMPQYSRFNRETRYIIENYRKALDAPGEWFLQSDGYLLYIPLPGETPENTRCMFPVNERFILVEGADDKHVEFIRFENLSFQVAAYKTPVSGNNANQAAAAIEATIQLDNAKNIDFLNCEIAHTGLHAIWFRKDCSYSRIEHCHLFDLGGGGVKIGDQRPGMDLKDTTGLTKHITVHNNIIHHGGYVFPCAVGVIIFHGSDNEITHNEIADFRYTGISVGWIWGYAHSPSKRNKIEFNHIHHLGWGELCDMGGVYTLGASEGTTVNNNVIHHIYSFKYGGWGLYTDEGSYNVRMENNLVYACKNAGFHQHYGKENIIRNNIFAYNLLSQLQFTRPEEHLSLIFTNNIIYFNEGLLYMSMGDDKWTKAIVNIDNNCYWDERTKNPKFHGNLMLTDWQKLGHDKHSILADPLFVNPQQFDFHFKNTSVVRKINFKPFDYSKAGVYGSQEWVLKAQLSSELEKAYDRIVDRQKANR